MMNEDQCIIADKYLSILINNEGSYTKSDVNEILNKEYGQNNTFVVEKTLLNEGLIEMHGILAMITREGSEAAKTGYNQYIIDLKEIEDLKVQANRAAVLSAKWNRIYAISAIGMSIVAIIISIISLLKK